MRGKCLDGPTGSGRCRCELGFYGANCSSLVARSCGSLPECEGLRANATTPRRWDAYSALPHFNYLDGEGGLHQVWYDDAESLGYKYALARSLGVRGVGAWTFDKLDYANATQRDAMWAAFDHFLLGPGP